MKHFDKPRLLVLSAAVLAAGATAALAQDAAPDAADRPNASDPGFQHVHDRSDRDGRRGGGHGLGGRGGAALTSSLFERADADGDGAVTQAEIDAFRAAEVQRADTGGDGGLDLAEFETLYREYTRPATVDVFQDLDDDGDGTVDAAEMDARFGDVVERLDRDGDDALSVEDRGRGRRG